MYPCVAVSSKALIDQLAYSYINYGHRFYVTGVVPDRLEPQEFDLRIIEKFRLNITRSERARRRAVGEGSIHFIRHERFWVLISTAAPAGNMFFEENTEPKTGYAQWKDVRKASITFCGYAIRAPGGVVRITVNRHEFSRVKGALVELAKYVPADRLKKILEREFPYEQYPGVQEQLYRLVGLVNHRLKRSRLGQISFSEVKRRRRVACGPRVVCSSEDAWKDKQRRAA